MMVSSEGVTAEHELNWPIRGGHTEREQPAHLLQPAGAAWVTADAALAGLRRPELGMAWLAQLRLTHGLVESETRLGVGFGG